MVAAPMTVTMLPTGENRDLEMSEELVEAIGRMPGGGMSADSMKQMAEQGFVSFPEGELTVGQTWTKVSNVPTPGVGKVVSTITATYDGPREVEGRTLEAISLQLDLQAAPAAEGAAMQIAMETRESSGEMLFDRETGRVYRSDLSMVIDVTATVAGQNIKSAMTQNVSLRAVADGEAVDLDAVAEEESMAEPAATE